MKVRLEPYDRQKHDQDKLAELIYQSDEKMNTLTYGSDALGVIRKLLEIPESYFVPDDMKCALVEDELVSVVVYYPVSEMEAVDKVAGRGFMKAMGFWSFFKKMLLFIKMDRMLGGDLDPDGIYIHTIAVDSQMRGRGIGSEILSRIAEENEKMYLYVNMNNEGAIRFYQKNGFTQKHLGKMTHKGEEFGEYLMERK